MNKPSHFVFLPTEKASEIFPHKGGDMCFNKTGARDKNEFAIPQHIYILSDEEIKEGNWYYHPINGATKWGTRIEDLASFCKKIIATTNPELLKEKRIDEGFVEISSVAKISQSDIEYIIGLHNGKEKEVDIDELAFKECGNDHYGKEKYREGYNQCLQDNADKKFTLEDMFAFCDWCQVNGYRACSSYSVNSERWMNGENIFTKKEIISSFMERFQKEQPKSDTVMVEYEQYVTNPDIHRIDAVHFYYSSRPKLKDGNIVIVR